MKLRNKSYERVAKKYLKWLKLFNFTWHNGKITNKNIKKNNDDFCIECYLPKEVLNDLE